MTDQKTAKFVRFSEQEHADLVSKVVNMLPDEPHKAVAVAAYIASTVIAATGPPANRHSTR